MQKSLWIIGLRFLLDARVRGTASWLLLVGVLGLRLYTAWTNFALPERADGNEGHTSIDFGGQWMMGRLLVTGHGRELYSRSTHLEIARQAYPRANERPDQETHDAEYLVSCYPGPSADPVGGPLYPPIHAFVMAPLGTIGNPQLAYRVWQVVLFLTLGLTAIGIRYLTRGRWWWTMAMTLMLLYPGSRGATDLGQNSPLTFALLVWGWACVVRGRPTWGGVLWGLLAFKPVWALSFLGALLFLQQWRALLAMMLTGLAAIAVTIPFVGLHAWFDWLHIGQLAASLYCVDQNWVFLSRDLFGIPRRIWLTFENGVAVRDRPFVGVFGWLLWLTVAGVTALVAWKRRHNVRRLGPWPALVFCAAWLCTYRFMYYDSLVGMLALVVLFASPRWHWQAGRRWTIAFVLVLFVIENITVPLQINVSASVMLFRGTSTHNHGETITTAPTIYLGTNDRYPWDTVAIVLLWLRLLWQIFVMRIECFNRSYRNRE